MGSVDLSGTASLSSRYLIALSKWPFPCFAAMSNALGPFPPLGRVGLGGPTACCANKADKSVEDVLKVW